MHVETQILPSWLRWEKRKHSALVVLAMLISGGLAAAASNERRMFLWQGMPAAFGAIAAPEPTSLRSAIMGYLDDGCAPDIDGSAAGFERAVDTADCGRQRKRPAPPPPAAEPAAFFAVPDDPLPFDSPLLVISSLPLEALPLPLIGRPGAGPIRPASLTPVALVSGSVPEPRSWALMILGFALAGGALRRRPASVPAARG